MEDGCATEQNLLVLELTRGRELVSQLEAQFDQQSGVDPCKPLTSKLMATLEKAICMAKSSDIHYNRQRTSTDSTSGSPRSESSDQAFKDRERRETSKKRKTLPKWTNQVQVGTGEGFDGPLDDGYNWRKYGQKDILGAKHPRAYYRCTHRITRGCPAIKQVQRSDENPSIFQVTYRGAHTCHQTPQQQKPIETQQPDLLLSFQTGLRVKTERLGSAAGQELASPSFSFPETPVGGLNHEMYIMDCGSLSSSFLSPATSESNYFSVSPLRISSYGGGPSLQGAESDLTEIISRATSATDSHMDFMLDAGDFDSGFHFDAASFFA